MKKVMLGLSALCMVAFTSCKDDAASKVKSENVAVAAERDANAGDFPVIQFDKTEHDFGTIQDGTPVETIFKYTNTGNTMLVVSDVKSTCGCTVPTDYTKQVAPGETGQFSVKFNGKGNNKISKTVTMTTNTAKGNEQVKISAFIEADPNAPAKPAATTATSGQSIMTTQQTSTQPGHEGHNHQ